jgi:hypothetical protein
MAPHSLYNSFVTEVRSINHMQITGNTVTPRFQLGPLGFQVETNPQKTQ